MIARRVLTDGEVDDLRRVAIHEAGHATIAAHFGIPGEIRIQPLTNRAANGVFSFTGCFVARAEPSDAHARCLYGLAGVAAQGVDGCWDSALPVLIGSMMSEPDKRLAGEFSDRDVLETVGLLKWLWAEVEMRAKVAMKPWLDGPMVEFNEGESAQLPTTEEPQHG